MDDQWKQKLKKNTLLLFQAYATFLLCFPLHCLHTVYCLQYIICDFRVYDLQELNLPAIELYLSKLKRCAFQNKNK